MAFLFTEGGDNAFRQFPTRIGFVVGEKDSVAGACKEALVSWAERVVTGYNLPAYLKGGDIRLVKTFPATDEGWKWSWLMTWKSMRIKWRLKE